MRGLNTLLTLSTVERETLSNYNLSTTMSGKVSQRVGELTKKLTSDPFFPLLFLSEAVKNGTFHALAGTPPLDVVGASVGMAVVSVVGWLYTSDDVAWGLKKASEAVDEVTDSEES